MAFTNGFISMFEQPFGGGCTLDGPAARSYQPTERIIKGSET